MRSLRAFLFLCVGLFLGGFSVFALAAASDYGRSMRLNAPESSRARFTGAPIYDWSDAPDGWGRMKDINKINIGSKAFDVTGGRLFSPQTLAKGAVSFARFGGPAWLGFMLAGLVWDEIQERWLIPGEDGGEPAPTGGGFTLVGPITWTAGAYTPSAGAAMAQQFEALLQFWDPSLVGLVEKVRAFAPATDNGGYALYSVTQTSGDRIRVVYRHPTAGYQRDIFIGWSGTEICESGERLTATGRCVNPTRPATDTELEDAIYTELVARGMGSDLARRLIEAGYKPQVDGIEIDGPSSMPGDTVTSTTSGPAGSTSTTTNTTHNITYNTNTTNNTSTVTITNTSTTTTTSPDGTTTTETTEEAPEGSTEPPPEEKPFCELYPEASACAKLDVPPVDPNESEDVTVTLTPTGGFGGEGGSCPPPFPFVVQGRSYQISYAQACDFFSAVRPVVVAAAMLSALLIALGAYKRD